jgi:hypothetical protein
MLPLRLPRALPVVVVALFVILVFHSSVANEELHLGGIDEAITPHDASIKEGSGSGSHAPVGDASAHDDTLAAWARSRLEQLQQQQQQQQHDNSENSDFSAHVLSLLNSDAESFTSPVDMRDLFYADAARAEVITPQPSFPPRIRSTLPTG